MAGNDVQNNILKIPHYPPGAFFYGALNPSEVVFAVRFLEFFEDISLNMQFTTKLKRN